jgi:hypothetical protein
VRSCAGECNTLEKQLSEVQASEAGLFKAKAALEAKLAELEELLATTTASRDELTGGWCPALHGGMLVFSRKGASAICASA